MQKKNVGRSDVEVSRLGFGAGGFWGMPVFDESVARELVEHALEMGITTFDTGPNYSNANAEVRLGRILGARAKNVVIGTKGGTHLRGSRHVKDYSYEGLDTSLNESLGRLGRDWVDIYQLHDMPATLDDATRRFLEDIKRSGKTRLLGVSTDVPGAEYALDLGIFDLIMIEYNVIVRKRQECVIERARAAGIGVFVKSPLAQTLYSNDILKVRSMSDLWYLARALKNHRHKVLLGRKYRFIKDHATALQFVLANPGVSAAIIGTTSPRHLAYNCEAARHPISPQLHQRINRVS